MTRIDLELVQRRIFKTRSKAKFAIENKSVYCNDKLVEKCSFDVNSDDKITINKTVLPYVSKGGLKLEKAIETFNISLINKNMLDIGSSTGGFSDCAIKYGINHILAVDVGSNQFSKEVLSLGKVTLLENTDFRDLNNSLLNDIEFATIDISFISVKKIIPKLNEIPNLKEIILLIKPQFECGMEIAKKYKGIVLNPSLHINIISNIISEFLKVNYEIIELTYSPIKGGNGNIEYLAYFKKNCKPTNIDISLIVKEAFLKLK